MDGSTATFCAASVDIENTRKQKKPLKTRIGDKSYSPRTQDILTKRAAAPHRESRFEASVFPGVPATSLSSANASSRVARSDGLASGAAV